METASLTERYVAAAVRGVPENQRDDLAAELRGSIGDQIEARVEAGELPADAERAVLTDLGDPDKLAAAYADRPSWLIGPRYFFEWWRLTKLLLWIVPPFAVFGVALGMTIAGEGFGEIMGAVWPVLIGVIVHIGFWTTLVFAILERSAGTSPLERSPLTKDGPWAPWTVERLPELPGKSVGVTDVVASILALTIAVGAILWDHFIGFVPGAQVSFFDPLLWPWWFAALLTVVALQALLTVVVYSVGRWTLALAAVNAVLQLAFALPALWLLTQGRLVNPEFWLTVLPDNAADVPAIIGVIAGIAIAGIAVWDIVDKFVKAARARR